MISEGPCDTEEKTDAENSENSFNFKLNLNRI